MNDPLSFVKQILHERPGLPNASRSSSHITHSCGIVDIPTGPGLGIEIDERVIEKYRVA